MLVRLVKLTLKKENIASFEQIFEETKDSIKGFSGCEHLELLKDLNNQNVFFTHSHWNSIEDLDYYRNSEFFKKVWTKTKVLFEEKAEAWSLESIQMTS